MKNRIFETPRAAEQPEWRRWHIEGVIGKETLLHDPDGRQYVLGLDEHFILVPNEPTDGELPKPFISAAGRLVPFADWAAQRDLQKKEGESAEDE